MWPNRGTVDLPLAPTPYFESTFENRIYFAPQGVYGVSEKKTRAYVFAVIFLLSVFISDKEKVKEGNLE